MRFCSRSYDLQRRNSRAYSMWLYALVMKWSVPPSQSGAESRAVTELISNESFVRNDNELFNHYWRHDSKRSCRWKILNLVQFVLFVAVEPDYVEYSSFQKNIISIMIKEKKKLCSFLHPGTTPQIRNVLILLFVRGQAIRTAKRITQH